MLVEPGGVEPQSRRLPKRSTPTGLSGPIKNKNPYHLIVVGVFLLKSLVVGVVLRASDPSFTKILNLKLDKSILRRNQTYIV